MTPETLRAKLLAWYDAGARDLAWRVGPADNRAGVRADPYRVWLSEVMLQQTTVPHATPYFLKFTARWPTVADLAAEEDGEVMAAWAGLGYYARARNLLACARAVAGEHGGVFPDTEEGLRALPGLGPYTAAAVSAIAFNRPSNVVDGNVERVMSRLFAVEQVLPDAKVELKRLAGALQAMSIAEPWRGAPLWWLQTLSLAWLVWQLAHRAGRQTSWSASTWIQPETGPAWRRAFGLAWLFGLGWLAGTFWWLFTSMHTYGGLNPVLAAAAGLGWILAGLGWLLQWIELGWRNALLVVEGEGYLGWVVLALLLAVLVVQL